MSDNPDLPTSGRPEPRPRISRLPWGQWLMLFFFGVCPTMISLYIAVEFRDLVQNFPPSQSTAPPAIPGLTCFPDQQCAVEVNGQWYAIDRPIADPTS